MAEDRSEQRAANTQGDGSTRLGSPRTALAVAAAVILAFFGGYLIRGTSPPPLASPHGHEGDDAAMSWICSMNNTHHPPVVKDAPGTCDYCGMELIPVAPDGVELGPRQLKLSEQAVRLAQIRVAPVERKFVEANVRMSGKVVYDETRVAHIAARVGGRIDDLYADYTGVPVRKGEHLFQIYSPEILAAQQELLQALSTEQELAESASPRVRSTATATVAASREKLRLWGLSKEQIRLVESEGVARDHITVNSPMNGVVVQKRAVEGSYVETGTVVYVVADLTTVWVTLDAYEADIARLRYAQTVAFTTDAYPGETFDGRIAFIDPIVNDRTRTVGVRVNVLNETAKLMPGMFVRGTISARLTSAGAVLDADLAGKWISPMHPEIVKDAPGTCDVCGMRLVPAESLGYAKRPDPEPPLVVPATAPLITGERAVVYLDLGNGVFEGRTIVLGMRAGDHYAVRDGLDAGDRVVVSGNFKIDSAIQILGKPSMMGNGGAAPAHQHGVAGSATKGSMTKGADARDHATHAGHDEDVKHVAVPPAVAEQLDRVFTRYFALQIALSRDDYESSRGASAALVSAIETIDTTALDEDAAVAWRGASPGLDAGARAAAQAKNIVELREAFQTASNALVEVAARLGPGSRASVYLAHCPMAFGNDGADWLTEKKTVENPYFGAQMFKCGVVKRAISSGDVE